MQDEEAHVAGRVLLAVLELVVDIYLVGTFKERYYSIRQTYSELPWTLGLTIGGLASDPREITIVELVGGNEERKLGVACKSKLSSPHVI